MRASSACGGGCMRGTGGSVGAPQGQWLRMADRHGMHICLSPMAGACFGPADGTRIGGWFLPVCMHKRITGGAGERKGGRGVARGEAEGVSEAEGVICILMTRGRATGWYSLGEVVCAQRCKRPQAGPREAGWSADTGTCRRPNARTAVTRTPSLPAGGPPPRPANGHPGGPTGGPAGKPSQGTNPMAAHTCFMQVAFTISREAMQCQSHLTPSDVTGPPCCTRAGEAQPCDAWGRWASLACTRATAACAVLVSHREQACACDTM